MLEASELSWYISHPDGPHGPLSPREFKTLVESGDIKSSTLVWSTGMPDWITYEQVAVGHLEFDDHQAARLLSPIKVSPTILTRDLQPSNAIAVEPSLVDRSHTDVVWIDVAKHPFAQTKGSRETVEQNISQWLSPWSVVLSAIVIVAATATYEWMSPSIDYKRLAVSDHDRTRLVAIAKRVAPVAPQAAIALSTRHDIQSPAFVIAAGLKDPQMLRILVSALPEAVIGKIRFSVETDVKLENRVATTPSLGHLNPGFYKVSVFPKNDNAKKPIGEATLFLGGINDNQYAEGIKTFKDSLRARTQEERVELGQAKEMLQQQLAETTRLFSQLKPSRQQRRWIEFDLQWSRLFSQVQSTLQNRINDESVLLAQYKRLAGTSHLIQELHRLQDLVFRIGLETDSDRQKMADLLFQASQDLRHDIE